MSTKKQKSVEQILEDALNKANDLVYDIQDLQGDLEEAQMLMEDAEDNYEQTKRDILKRLEELLAKK